MKPSIRWTVQMAAPLALLCSAPMAAAQGPAPEGTVITNVATATWSDANGNAYAPVMASASVTVAFLAAPDVSSASSVSPASPSTGNELVFTIANRGNGVDSVRVGMSLGFGISVTGYRIGSATYSTHAEFNDALALLPIPAGSSIEVVLIYSVAPGLGGTTGHISLTAGSRRSAGIADSSLTTVVPPIASGVTVTPEGGTVERLPGNGRSNMQEFMVQNTGNASGTFHLAAEAGPGSLLGILSVNGSLGSQASVTLGPGSSTTVQVVYMVGDGAAGSTDTLRLLAQSATGAPVSDRGDVTIRLVKAALSMTKEVFRDDQATPVGTSPVLPGEYLQYRLSASNVGTADAAGVSVRDPIPAGMAYVSSTPETPGWTVSESGGIVTATLAGTLAPGTSRAIWIRVRVN